MVHDIYNFLRHSRLFMPVIADQHTNLLWTYTYNIWLCVHRVLSLGQRILQKLRVSLWAGWHRIYYLSKQSKIKLL